MTMSVKSRCEHLNTMRQRYQQTTSRTEKTKIINEAVKVFCHRKHATTVLNQPPSASKPPVKRHRPLKYLEAIPVIQSVWEALDYPCAGRLHPMLLPTAEILAKHDEISLTEEICEQLSQISRATLARRLANYFNIIKNLKRANLSHESLSESLLPL